MWSLVLIAGHDLWSCWLLSLVGRTEWTGRRERIGYLTAFNCVNVEEWVIPVRWIF